MLIERDVVEVGSTATRVNFIALVVVGGAFVTVTFAFLELAVLRPLSGLTGEIRRVAAADDPAARVAAPRGHADDEIGLLVNGARWKANQL
eukprot:tig00000455_g1017.t1